MARPRGYDPFNNTTVLRRPVEPGQYTAVTFGSACRAHGITQSNSRKGSPHDNAAKESFFASLEKERLRRRTFATHEQARSSVFQYIEEFYNRRRLHSTLGYRSPTSSSATITSRSSSPRPSERYPLPPRGSGGRAARGYAAPLAPRDSLRCEPARAPPKRCPQPPLPCHPSGCCPTLTRSTQNVSTERGAVHGCVPNTDGGNAAANAPNEGLGRLPDRTVPALQAQFGDPLGAGGRDHRRSANALTHGRRL